MDEDAAEPMWSTDRSFYHKTGVIVPDRPAHVVPLTHLVMPSGREAEARATIAQMAAREFDEYARMVMGDHVCFQRVNK